MSDLIDDPEPGQNAPEFTVTEVSGAVKRTIEGAFSRVRVRGEVGRVSRPRSGHIYLDLKDDRAVLAGVIWKGVSARLATQPEEGMEVVATGKLTTFGGQSKYQMVIEDIAPAGMGALMAMLEKRKKMLEAEGLFAPERKRELPYLPEVIGVVTSPSGAVIRDILHRLRDRFPRKVLIWPVAVQGAKCAPEVAAAINGFNAMTPGGSMPRPDLLIVARGGGSIEDLWGFNEEVVARAAAASEIPLISAVGHETDTTLIDFAADRRAPTPTAAAEMAVPVRLDLMSHLDTLGGRLLRGVSQGTTLRRQRLADVSRALPRPETLLDSAKQRLDIASLQLGPNLQKMVQGKRLELQSTASPLHPRILRSRIAHLEERSNELAKRLGPSLVRNTATGRDRLNRAEQRLQPDVIRRDIKRSREKLDGLNRRFAALASSQVAAHKERLNSLERMRQTLGYTETLKRGYAVVRDDAGGLVTTADAANAAAGLEIQFQDGRVQTGKGTATSGSTPQKKPQKKPAKKTPPPEDQGSLF
ncbi:exodeoxyribonuclease VII large subunit [Halocynthiibacter sp. C4]|uniref:exodeoxyribonuclease VII large subunit n=1 Tax=Halocynthiibacter sp. C4 TaxID=2992758 RepID=UPI00237BB99C|nr:exodeoxyribonuclease VII large subunit [Halocynthiibacter sp. C4]MDE0590128.1 exodeoxyribonuclease VII large subunit [Halocynthiibacter sp. C4]